MDRMGQTEKKKWGSVNLDRLIKFILVEFGLGKAEDLVKFSLFDFCLAKVDVTNTHKKNIHDDMLSCCATKKTFMQGRSCDLSHIVDHLIVSVST